MRSTVGADAVETRPAVYAPETFPGGFDVRRIRQDFPILARTVHGKIGRAHV